MIFGSSRKPLSSWFVGLSMTYTPIPGTSRKYKISVWQLPVWGRSFYHRELLSPDHRPAETFVTTYADGVAYQSVNKGCHYCWTSNTQCPLRLLLEVVVNHHYIRRLTSSLVSGWYARLSSQHLRCSFDPSIPVIHDYRLVVEYSSDLVSSRYYVLILVSSVASRFHPSYSSTLIPAGTVTLGLCSHDLHRVQSSSCQRATVRCLAP